MKLDQNLRRNPRHSVVFTSLFNDAFSTPQAIKCQMTWRPWIRMDTEVITTYVKVTHYHNFTLSISTILVIPIRSPATFWHWSLVLNLVWWHIFYNYTTVNVICRTCSKPALSPYLYSRLLSVAVNTAARHVESDVGLRCITYVTLYKIFSSALQIAVVVIAWNVQVMSRYISGNGNQF